jgi:hypothetical protein
MKKKIALIFDSLGFNLSSYLIFLERDDTMRVVLKTTNNPYVSTSERFRFLSQEDFMSFLLSGELIAADLIDNFIYGFLSSDINDHLYNIIGCGPRCLELLLPILSSNKDYDVKIFFINADTLGDNAVNFISSKENFNMHDLRKLLQKMEEVEEVQELLLSYKNVEKTRVCPCSNTFLTSIKLREAIKLSFSQSEEN